MSRSKRRVRLLPADERKLVRMFGRNSGSIKAKVCHEVETAKTPASLSQ